MAEAELFSRDEGAAESPRLAWLKRHDIHTWQTPNMPDEEKPWSAFIGEDPYEFADKYGCESYGCGVTEGEAIEDLCRRLKIPLWHEEAFAAEKQISNHGLRR